MLPQISHCVIPLALQWPLISFIPEGLAAVPIHLRNRQDVGRLGASSAPGTVYDISKYRDLPASDLDRRHRLTSDQRQYAATLSAHVRTFYFSVHGRPPSSFLTIRKLWRPDHTYLWRYMSLRSRR